MGEIVLATENTADLPEEYYQEHGIEEIYLSYIMDGKTYTGENSLSAEEFYARVRQGAMPTTSQVNAEELRERYLRLLKEGKEILHLCFSSGLSGSCGVAVLAANTIREQIPEAKIEVVDTLCASMGQGLLVHKVCEKKEANPDITLEELAAYARELVPNLCHNFTVDDLNHLHRGGRVSKTTAVVGTLVGIKPVLHVDDEGHLISLTNVRGRKKSLAALVDRMEKQGVGFENDIVFISHGDCLEDAEYVKRLIEERLGIHRFLINPIGPVIGAHSGPGTVALFFVGSPR